MDPTQKESKAEERGYEVARALSLSIKEGKWVDIQYESKKEGRVTYFWAYVEDIDPLSQILACDIYNDRKGFDTLTSVHLDFKRILSATLLPFTTNGVNEPLIDKINADLDAFAWLKYETFDNNILDYLERCLRYDGDPSVKKTSMVDGIDSEVLDQKGEIPLNETQMKQLGDAVREGEAGLKNCRSDELSLSRISIDEGSNHYVLAYEPLAFSPKSKSLRKVGGIRINPTFLIEGKKHSLGQYTELNAPEFLDLLHKDYLEACSLIREALRKGEILNTRPEIFCLAREYQIDIKTLFATLERKWAEKTLNAPLRAFFGNSSYLDNGRKKPELVFFDSKVNADQAFAAYSALKNKVTYVQGPPGTGKTNTIFNVALSCFFSGKTLLISTNNNRPLDSIQSRFASFFQAENIPFPFLRIGNRQVDMEAMEELRVLFDGNYEPTLNEAQLEELRRKVLSKNKEAVERLTLFQERKSLEENLAFLEKVSSSGRKRIVEKQKESLEKKLEKIPALAEKEIISAFVCLEKDQDALSYLKEASLRNLKKLQSPRFLPLREIVFSPSPEKSLYQFSSYLKSDENLSALSKVFPLILSTIVSTQKLGTSSFLFDLVILDEAGQADIARSLLPLSRGKALLLVGDEDQLLPVITLDPGVEEKLRQKFKISSTYAYLSNSILSTMKEADKVSNRILLRYHYRCGKKIIAFNNDYFYHKQLRIPSTLAEGSLEFYPSQNFVHSPLRNQNFQEAANVVAYLKKENLEDVAIITPFVNQASLINSLLSKEGIKNVKASTIHSVQGDEKNTVLISTGVSAYSSNRTLSWLNQHGEIANVAVSRAKRKLVVFGDKEKIEQSSTGDGVWNALFRYCEAKGTVEVIPPEYKNASIGRSNASLTEDQFYETIQQIVSLKGKLLLRRNVLLKDVLGEDCSSSAQEFDSVIYAKPLFKKETPILAFEFDGGEHFSDRLRIDADKRKMEACKKEGLPLLRIPNSFSKDYEFLKELIEDYAEDKKEGEQLTLF